MKIGNLTTKSNIFLAPLHRFNDPAFLNLCSKMGAGIVFTGMVSSYKIVSKGIDFKIIGDTKPIAIQIFGSDEEIMGKAAKISSDFFDLIDINLGCPSRKVFESGSGSALLSDLKKLRRIIRIVIKNASVPVSAKIRSGVNKRNKNFIEVGKLLEEEGVSMITLHPRTVDMGFSGRAEWEEIKVSRREDLAFSGRGMEDRYEGFSVEYIWVLFDHLVNYFFKFIEAVGLDYYHSIESA